jgi:hypothetical protein
MATVDYQVYDNPAEFTSRLASKLIKKEKPSRQIIVIVAVLMSIFAIFVIISVIICIRFLIRKYIMKKAAFAMHL